MDIPESPINVPYRLCWNRVPRVSGHGRQRLIGAGLVIVVGQLEMSVRLKANLVRQRYEMRWAFSWGTEDARRTPVSLPSCAVCFRGRMFED